MPLSAKPKVLAPRLISSGSGKTANSRGARYSEFSKEFDFFRKVNYTFFEVLLHCYKSFPHVSRYPFTRHQLLDGMIYISTTR